MGDLRYYDQDGNQVTLNTLCRKEPDWAANRLRAELATVRRLRKALDGLVEAEQFMLVADPGDSDDMVDGWEMLDEAMTAAKAALGGAKP